MVQPEPLPEVQEAPLFGAVPAMLLLRRNPDRYLYWFDRPDPRNQLLLKAIDAKWAEKEGLKYIQNI